MHGKINNSSPRGDGVAMIDKICIAWILKFIAKNLASSSQSAIEKLESLENWKAWKMQEAFQSYTAAANFTNRVGFQFCLFVTCDNKLYV